MNADLVLLGSGPLRDVSVLRDMKRMFGAGMENAVDTGVTLIVGDLEELS